MGVREKKKITNYQDHTQGMILYLGPKTNKWEIQLKMIWSCQFRSRVEGIMLLQWHKYLVSWAPNQNIKGSLPASPQYKNRSKVSWLLFSCPYMQKVNMKLKSYVSTTISVQDRDIAASKMWSQYEIHAKD